MQTKLLQTKLHIPAAREKRVARPRLLARLEQGLSRKLILVSTPAGFGKTCLLAGWLRDLPSSVRVGWLSLDERDNDPETFMQYLAAALDLDEVTRMLGDVNSSPAQVTPFLTEILNRLTADGNETLLVLDDFHFISNPAIHEAIAFLLEHAPAHFHLVLLTRVDPPLPLARLRSRDQMVELRAEDLRFSLPEATDFLNQVMGLDIPDDGITNLEQRTEGWIAGLQMAALSIQGREDVDGFINAFTGSHRFILDYLTEEVLNRQPEAVRAFLLQTSILDRFHAPLCQAISEYEDAQAMLNCLEDANLFLVPLDDERRWYRYHHLFADLLQAALRQQDPHLPDDLRRRAAHWCGENDLLEDAIEYALAARDYTFAADQIEKVVRAMLIFDNRDTLRNWIDRLPPELVEEHPWLGAARALTLTASGQLDPARQLLSRAREKLAGGRLPTKERAQLEGLIAGLDAWIAEKENNLDATLALAKQAMEKLPVNSPIFLFAAILAGDVLFLRGDLVQAEQARQQVLQAARQSGRLTYQILMLLGLGHISYWRGQLERASDFYLSVAGLVRESHIYSHYLASAKFAQAGVFLSRDQLDDTAALAQEAQDILLSSSVGHSRITPALMMIARVHLAKGELGQAQALLAQAEATMQGIQQYPNVMAEWDDFRVRLWLAQGDLEHCQRWAESIRGDLTDLTGYCSQLQALAVTRILLAQARSSQAPSLNEALTLLEDLSAVTESQGQHRRLIEVLVLQAVGLLVEHKLDQAGQSIQKALGLAAPEKILRPFLDEKESLQKILPSLKNKLTEQDPFMDDLFAALSLIPQPRNAIPGLVEPLTERERDVLRLMAAGLSNPEIGQELYLSLNTIKTHIRGIYGKLGVNNRTQAANRARELGLA